MSFTDELSRSRFRDEATSRSSRPRARGVEDVVKEDVVEAEPEAPREKPIVLLARSWKRVMLAEDGKLHSDGKLIIRDLFKQAGFFSRVQFVAGNHDQTLVLAVKRQFVVHILACLGLSETEIDKQVGRAMALRDEVFGDD